MDNRIRTGSRMDMNHYTAICLKWSLGSSRRTGSGGGDQTLFPDTPDVLTNPVITVNPDNHTNPVVISPPTVKITDPGADPYRTSSGYLTVKADIRNAGGSDNILFFQDGVQKSNFTYNSYTKIFSVSVTLHEGDNNLRIIAKNAAGKAEDGIRIIRVTRETGIPAPTVHFTYPNTTLFNSESEILDISARVQNVSNKENIQLRLNGRTTFFNFQPGNGTVSASVNLNEGTNTLSITADNPSGSAADELTVTYRRQAMTPPPVILFINPRAPVDVQDNLFPLRAQIRNVSSRNDVTLSVNGYISGNFVFSSSGELSANLNLREGLNNIEISGRNEAGNRSERTTIRYEQPVLLSPPVIQILVPAVNPYRTSGSTTELRASISNMDSPENIILNINGTNTRNFSFNAGTGDFRTNLALAGGQNIITITAQNGAGRDVSSQIIIQEAKPCPRPEISLPTSQDQLTTADQTYVFSASLLNIENRNQLRLTLNDNPVAFDFNGRTLRYTVSLRQGMNTLRLTAENECGEDSRTVRVNYIPEKVTEPCHPPLVSINLTKVDRADATHELRGTVTNVKNKSDISVTVNGKPDQGFQFVPATGQITAKYKFNPGTSTVTVYAANACGNNNKTVSVSIAEPCHPPLVSINLTQVDRADATHELRGTVTNVKNKSDISVTVNGKPDQGFQFVPATGQITAKYKFNPGTSTVTVYAANDCGNNNRTVSVNTEEPCHPPLVSINLTKVDRADATHELRGTVTNVKNKSDISVTVNGKPDQGFQYVPATGQITAKYKFNPGTSTVTVYAANTCGNDNKTISVSLQEPCSPPQVNVSLTQVDRTDATHELRGTVTNVKNKSDITVTVNGKPDQGFQYVPATGQITAKYKFTPGTTTVVVSAKNECGNDSKSVSVNMEEPCQPPQVSMNLVAVNRTDATHELSGTVTNVKNKSDISVTVNGRPDQGFQFVPATGQISCKV